MPLPLYGSGGRTSRTSAAISPTCCLSMPLTTISVCVGTSKVIPAGASTTTECEKPTLSSRAVPRSAARYPTPWISRRFSKPFVTPSTMFATSDRVSPWRARSSPRSVGRVTTRRPSSLSIVIRAGTFWVSSPSGPFTVTRPGSTATLTPSGISMGCLPIRLIASPDETDDLSADSLLLGGPARYDPAGRGEDRRAHAPEHPRQPVLPSVHAAPGLRDALEVGDDPFPIATELQLDDQAVEGAVLSLVLLPAVVVGGAENAVVADVTLLLEDAGDLLLELGVRHLGGLVHRLVGVAEAREHVCDRICVHGYQLDLVMPGIWPSCASSRRQIRQRPNLR